LTGHRSWKMKKESEDFCSLKTKVPSCQLFFKPYDSKLRINNSIVKYIILLQPKIFQAGEQDLEVD
jgi:hypothetical protein